MRTSASVMVGRDDEVHEIALALKAAQTGCGQALFVIGEAGIGKSRLSAATADLGSAADMTVLRGRGSAIGPVVPFRPLTEALMSLVRAGDAFDISRLGPYRPVLARLIPDWGTPSAVREGSSLIILAEAVLRVAELAGRGRGRGCLLLLDDLQESDAETLAVVDYLVDNIGRQPTVLLGAIRADPSPALDLARSAARRGSATLMELNRLTEPQVRRLAASCLDASPADVPDQVLQRLWTDSGGVPLFAEELLGDMRRSGLLVRDGEEWLVTGALRRTVSSSLISTVATQLDKLGPQRREILSTAAVLGRRFPLAVLPTAVGADSGEVMGHLHADVTTQLVAPDEEPGWYTFRHPLIAEAMLALLTPAERSRLARRAAEAVQQLYPGLPGQWCQITATLLQEAGDPAAAGRLFTEAGRRAQAQGAAVSAVTLLDKALELFSGEDTAQARADAFASLLYALAEAGLVERAVTTAEELEQLASLLSPRSRAELHTRLAWAAMVAGRTEDGMAQVDLARGLLGPDAQDRDSAPIDVVAAHLMLDIPGPDGIRTAEELARRAATVAETARLPIVACQAWQLLGALTRSRDPDEATACLHRARRLAVRHGLPVEEIHALIRLGNDDALREGDTGRLEQARREATRIGAVTSRYQAEASIALQAVLRGDFTSAEALIDEVQQATSRLRLLETTRYVILLRAVLGAHRCRRRDMDAALADLHRWEGADAVQHEPRIHGLARAWCALLEENRPRALQELSRALAAEDASPGIFQLTGRYGLRVLLRALEGDLDRSEYEAITTAPLSRMRWDRQFSMFAHAVLSGREGRAEEAAEAVAEAVRLGAPYGTARHVGLRLVSEAAIADHWGTPIDWLRTSEEYFHAGGVIPVASACRALMRTAGASIAQRRDGAADIPPPLRAVGVTVREYEVFQLLALRLGNREIAARLHLSPRTVEKHVASLVAKTGQRNRIAVSEWGSAMLPSWRSSRS